MGDDIRIGDIVLYKPHSDGLIRPAIVTHVWDLECVNLTVFPDGGHPDEGIHPMQTSVVLGDGERQWQHRG